MHIITVLCGVDGVFGDEKGMIVKASLLPNGRDDFRKGHFLKEVLVSEICFPICFYCVCFLSLQGQGIGSEGSLQGSATQYPFLGSSANLNLQKLVAGNSSYVDVEFIDPVIMAVSRGKLPLPMTHQISPDYNFNMLANFSEMDQRL
ncbi:uncharacterized protein LOC131231829 [Magnolia sinica]|uniref:uncharacterized protein LOC131231829 n=1 Tax=Magnolia sinica TaxID=86752 RepID=UPI00265B0BCC|nr:uncharacterized protein LOC131231829 [Magnolia sinica]